MEVGILEPWPHHTGRYNGQRNPAATHPMSDWKTNKTADIFGKMLIVFLEFNLLRIETYMALTMMPAETIYVVLLK